MQRPVATMTIVSALCYLIENGYLAIRFPTAAITTCIHDFQPMEIDLMFSYRVVAVGGSCHLLREHADGSTSLYFVARHASGEMIAFAARPA